MIKNMIAALYARVSTAGQEKEKTVKSQIDEVLLRAAHDGNSIPERLQYIDEGWSGDILARPALDKLRDDASHKVFDVLYVWDRDRIARRYAYQEFVIDELQESNIQLVDLQSAPIRNPEDKILMGFKGLFAEYERLKITERMRRGKMYKVKNGILFGWEAPYGYKYVKKNDNNPGRFEIDENESKVIKMIFSWVGNDEMTVRQVIKRLYEMGISPRKSKKGYWSTSTLSKRLRDQTYIGITYYNKTLSVQPKTPQTTNKYKRIKKSSRTWKERSEWKAIAVPAIVDKDLFARVQKQLAINNTFAMRNKKNQYLLSNVISCTCGHTRAGEGIKGTQNLYYRCTDRIHRFPLPKQCHNKGVNAPKLDAIAWSKLSALLSDPKRIKKYYERWKSEKSAVKTNPLEIEKLYQSEMESLTEQEKRYLQAYGSGAITLDQYKEQSHAIKLKKQAYMSKFSTQTDKNEPTLFVVPDFKAVCDKMNTILDKRVFEKRRHIIQKLSIRVVTDGTTATMSGRLPITTDTDFSQENIKYEIEYRYRWSSKRRKKHFV